MTMTEIIKMPGGGTLTYSPGRHQYHWHDAEGVGGKVDLSVSAVAGSYPLAFGAASGWAAKVIREELLKSDVEIPTAGDDGRLDWAKEICKGLPHVYGTAWKKRHNFRCDGVRDEAVQVGPGTSWRGMARRGLAVEA